MDDVRLGPGVVRLGHLLVRSYQRTVLGAAVVVAWTGALTAPAHLTVLVAPVVGALAVGAVRVGAAALGLGRPSSRTLALSGLAGLLVVPFVSGVTLFGPLGAALLMALLMTSSSLLAGAARLTSPPLTRGEVDRLRGELSGLPLTEVLRHWERTSWQVGGHLGHEARTVAADFRCLLLDELARRDPAGVEGWLRSGDDDPRRHLPSGDAGRAL